MSLKGVLDETQREILKDDRCNTNVLSKDFVNKRRHILKVQQRKSIISHSDIISTENSSEIVLETNVEIGKHVYRSNWVVGSCRYEMLLSMPWYAAMKPMVD